MSPDSLASFLGPLQAGYDDKPVAESVLWRPQARQQTFLDACGFGKVLDGGPLEAPKLGDWSERRDRLIGYGGAAGGGKTDADLGLAALAMCCVPGIRVAFFRRTLKEAEDSQSAIDRSWDIIGSIPGAKYNGSKYRWRLPNGSSLQFCHCEHEKDRYKYKSAQFDILIIDEATSFSWLIVDFLLTRNRATVTWPGFDRGFAFAVLTTNPGDIGHQWYRELLYDHEPHDTLHTVQNWNDAATDIIFFPAKLEDNPILRERDPDYEAKLESRNPTLAKAMRWGIWDIAGGLFFGKHWRRIQLGERKPHVIPAFEIPAHWPLYGSVDYGFHPRNNEEKPFVYGLYTSSEDGHIYRIDELAAAHWDPDKQIEEIKRLEARYPKNKVRYRCGCPGMWIKKEEGAPTIAERYAIGHVSVIQSNCDVVNGYARFLMWLNDHPDGSPFFQSFDTCKHFNRIIPSLPCDDRHPDEVDPNSEDHCAEEARHFLMSRPSPARLSAPKVPEYSAAGILQKQLRVDLKKLKGRR